MTFLEDFVATGGDFCNGGVTICCKPIFCCTGVVEMLPLVYDVDLHGKN
jgi:hypothetical protein